MPGHPIQHQQDNAARSAELARQQPRTLHGRDVRTQIRENAWASYQAGENGVQIPPALQRALLVVRAHIRESGQGI